MATNFPTSLDALANPTAADNLDTAGVLHDEQHANANDSIEALEAKVGADSSAVATSHDNKIAAMITSLAGKQALSDLAFVRKTANELVVSSTVLQDDNHLFKAIGANETWEFEWVLRVYDTDASGDLRIAVATPASPAGGGVVVVGGSPTDAGAGFYNDLNATITGIPILGGSGVIVKALVRNGANAGNVTLQWAQSVSNATSVTILAESYLTGRRIP